MKYSEVLDNLFNSFGLKAKTQSFRREGSFLICDIILLPGGTVSKIEKHSMEIALALFAKSEPLIYPITSEGIIRLEIMIEEPETVYFSNLVGANEFINSNCSIPLILGNTRTGKPLIVDLSKMPHLLIGGTTGSGKSILLHSIIRSVLSGKSDRVAKLALIDPKQVEFSMYEGYSSLWDDIARNGVEAEVLLEKLIIEMDKRFEILRKHKCRDISQYKKLPYIIVVIDELADLMMTKKSLQELICKLAQKSRACGIHLVVATQRPSTDIITGPIKANFPSRISCHVASAIDSRVILDKSGAEKLIGAGDAILDSPSYSFIRFKGAFVDLENLSKKSWWTHISWTKR